MSQKSIFEILTKRLDEIEYLDEIDKHDVEKAIYLIEHDEGISPAELDNYVSKISLAITYLSEISKFKCKYRNIISDLLT